MIEFGRANFGEEPDENKVYPRELMTGLRYYDGTLTIRGSIEADSGTIGGWSITDDAIVSKDRELILGGVKIESDFGLSGHSDADVLVHAIIDSLLGAAALGDIGQLFPDNDMTYKGISSIYLLKKVCEKIYDSGYKILNIDSTLIMQKPKISGYTLEMRQNIAEACNISVDNVSVKATTEEKLGFTGRSEGASAQAVCLIE